MSQTAEEIFWKPYKNRDTNFITPHVEGYYLIQDGAVELSSGRGILTDGNIYGVTVTRNGERFQKDSQCFDSRDKAMRHIQKLQGETK